MATKMVILFRIFLILVFIAGIYVIIEFYARKDKEGITTGNECSNLLIKKAGKILLYNTTKPLVENVNPVSFSHLDEYVQYLERQRSGGKQCPILFLKEESEKDTITYTITTPPSADEIFQTTVTPPIKENMEPQIPLYEQPPVDVTGGIMNIPTKFSINTMTPYNDNGDKSFFYSVTGFIANNFTKPFSDFVLSNTAAPIANRSLENMANGEQQAVNVVDASRESAKYNMGQYHGFDPTSQYQGVYTDIDALHDSTSAQGLSDNPMDTNWGGVLYTQDQINSGKYDENNIFRPSLVQPKFSFGLNKNPVGGPVDVLEPEKSPQPFTRAPMNMAPLEKQDDQSQN
jgi:hypothetical protein